MGRGFRVEVEDLAAGHDGDVARVTDARGGAAPRLFAPLVRHPRGAEVLGVLPHVERGGAPHVGVCGGGAVLDAPAERGEDEG
jgi:hypothetical protein